MSKLIINFEAMPDLSVPYPVAVTDGTVTSGLLPQDTGANLIGFGVAGQYHIDVFPADAIEDPSLVVGLVPTFSKGTMFEWNVPVRELTVVEA